MRYQGRRLSYGVKVFMVLLLAIKVSIFLYVTIEMGWVNIPTLEIEEPKKKQKSTRR